MRRLLIFVFGFIVLEMIVLIALGRTLGLLPTLALVLGAGMAGAWLARREGVRAAMRIRNRMAAGAVPAAEMTDGLMIAAAAILLIVPGALTDVIGLALLFPPTRALIKYALAAKFAQDAAFSRFTVDQTGAANSAPHGGDRIVEARVIETRVTDS